MSQAGMAGPGEEIILGGGQYQLQDTGKVNFLLSIIDLQSQIRHLVPMDFLPHGIHCRPDNRFLLALFEKKGPGACIYDLRKQQTQTVIPPLKNRYFYGHGAYTRDSKQLLSTETFLDSLDGVITIRDSNTLKHLGDFPSYGKEPHECKLIDDGATLVVTNGGSTFKGESPSVTYIDIKSQQLLERIELSNERLNTGHMAISDKGDLLIVSAPRAGLDKTHLGGVSIRPVGQKIETVSEPQDIVKKMYGEALSTCIHNELGIAAVTHPDSNMMTFWSIKNRAFLKSIALHLPRGVALTRDKKYFLVSAGAQASLLHIDVKTLTIISPAVMEESLMSGSHIYNWSS